MRNVLFAALVTLSVAPVCAAQERRSSGGDERVRGEIRDCVEAFLRKLGNRDVPGVRALLTPNSAMLVVSKQPDGSFKPSYQNGEEFLAALEKNANGPKFEEPLENVRVTVDSGTLGYLRADFTVVRDSRVMSSGVDQFTLVKGPDGWKIAVTAYTSIPARAATR